MKFGKQPSKRFRIHIQPVSALFSINTWEDYFDDATFVGGMGCSHHPPNI